MKVYRAVLEMLRKQEQGVLVTVLGSRPPLERLTGKHLLFTADCSAEGAMYDGDPEDATTEFSAALSELSRQVLASKQFLRQRLELGTQSVDLMLEPVLPVPRLIILGCGHVGQALATMAHLTGFATTVVDDRPIFANSEIFPAGTEVICDDFSRAIDRLNPGVNDFVVIVTRGHQYDRICLTQLTSRQLAYVGMIGSKRRVKELFAELEKEGVSAEWLARVYSPVGLEIGAETPAEIAVSIMAEIIRVRRKGA